MISHNFEENMLKSIAMLAILAYFVALLYVANRFRLAWDAKDVPDMIGNLAILLLCTHGVSYSRSK